MFTTIDNCGTWIGHADGCRHIDRDARILGAGTDVRTHDSFETMADFYGAFDLATDSCEPGTEDYYAEVCAQTLSGIHFCPCISQRAWDAAQSYANDHAGGRISFYL